MPRYQYQAIDTEGVPRVETVEATSQHELADRLHEEGYQVNRIDRIDLPAGIVPLKGRLTWAELTQFNDHLQMAVEAHMPLSPALAAFARDLKGGRLKQTVETLHAAIDGGESLDDALLRMGDRFPPIYTAVVRAGQRSGNLPAVLSMMTEYSRRTIDLRSHVQTALIYPVFVLVVAVIILIAMLLYVIPTFGAFYNDFGARLPWLTLFWLRMSKSIQMDWPEWLLVISGVIIGGTVAWKLLRRSENGNYWLDRIFLRLPLVGKIARADAMARFSRTLGLLLGSHVPVEDALLLAGASTGNMVMTRASQQALVHVENGESLSASIERTRRFGHLFCWLLSNAERETSDIRKALINLSENYEQRAVNIERAIKLFIGPVIIVLLGLIIGSVIMSLYLPIFSLADTMSG